MTEIRNIFKKNGRGTMRGECGMTDNNYKNGFRMFEGEAEEIISGRKSTNVIQKASELCLKVPMLKDLAKDIPVMVNMVKDYTRKKYKRVPKKTITMIATALIYFVNPMDIVPDNIPGVGYLDDAAVITYVLKSVKDDVDEYKEWKTTAWSA